MPKVPFFDIVRSVLFQSRRTGVHDADLGQAEDSKRRSVLIVGSPNVGKSVLFGRLTGKYVTVSNYPGTTVEVSRGLAEIHGKCVEIIDTPGMLSLQPTSEEERVARQMLIAQGGDVVVHVVEAKSLERMLSFTIQLLELQLPLILVINMVDEAEGLGMRIDAGLLNRRLGIPVVATVATTGSGVEGLRAAIGESLDGRG